MKKIFLFLLVGGTLSLYQNVQAQDWSLSGNAGTNPATDYIGTSDNKVLKIKTNNQVRMYIKGNGDIGVGTITPSSKFHVNGVITATGGTSNDWNTAFSWGNHALAGYLLSESDPQVGTIATNFIPRWNGSSLVTGNLYTSGSFLGLNTTTAIGSGQFVVNSTTTGYGGMYVNTTGTTGGQPFYGYAANGVSNCWTYFKQDNSEFTIFNGADRLYVENDGDVRIGRTSATTSRLDVLGNLTSTSPTLNVAINYTGTADVRGIYTSAVAADGYGYGIEAHGGYRGVYGAGDGGAYTGGVIGVQGTATGSGGVRYGVYGSASGGTENWGGYFVTKTYTNELRVGGTTGATGYVLAVNGKAIAEEVRVELAGSWPDYVFDSSYELMPLEQLKKEIETNKHLPGIPSAVEMEEQGGVDLGAMQTKLVEKVEELTLYILQLKAQNDKLQQSNEELLERMNKVEGKN